MAQPIVNMILGRLTTVVTSKRSRKDYALEVLQVEGGPSKKTRTEVVIRFNDSDSEGIKFPHDDALVIIPVMDNSSVKRVLVDGGASVDILFHEAFIRMRYNNSQLTPSDMTVYGFNGVKTKVEGIIQLPMMLGQVPYEVTRMLNFWVIKAVTTYNAIFGRTGINAFQAVASTYHLKLKFPTKNDIGMEEEDQKLARSCYVTTLKVGGKTLPLEDMDVREDEER